VVRPTEAHKSLSGGKKLHEKFLQRNHEGKGRIHERGSKRPTSEKCRYSLKTTCVAGRHIFARRISGRIISTTEEKSISREEGGPALTHQERIRFDKFKKKRTPCASRKIIKKKGCINSLRKGYNNLTTEEEKVLRERMLS